MVCSLSSLQSLFSDASSPIHTNLNQLQFDRGMNRHGNEGNSMSSYLEEETVIKNKYGGMLPKKKPLISKDHERAFFDSADWALGKQGSPAQKPKGPLEALRPKLQPTRQQQSRSRRSAYAPADGEDGGSSASEDINCNE